jgi:hypothetical protein
MLLVSPASQLSTTKLDEMYTLVLEHSVIGGADEDEKDMRTRLFKKVVGSIVILFNSLSAMALTELLAVSAGEMNGTLQPMHSVLDISDDLDSPIRVFGHKIFSRGPSMWLSQHRRSAQALIGLGTGRSPSSSGCSPSAQALLSRAQSRSSTLSSAPIMHFLTRPSCRGRLVKFRRRFSGCEVVEI